jgi:hypothetical protein
LAALDFQGRIVWRKEIVPYTFDVTLGSSPILYRDTWILLCAMSAQTATGSASPVADLRHHGEPSGA